METTTQIVEYNPIAAALADLNARFAGVVFDVTKDADLKSAKEARNEIRGYRTALEAKRTELKAPILERGRLLDTEARRITAELEKLEKPIAVQIDAEDARREEERQRKILAEQQRVAAINRRIEAIRGKVIAGVNMAADELAATIDSIAGIDLVEFAEFAEKAKTAIDETVAQLQTMLGAKRRAEEEAARVRAENERLRVEREAFERQQAEARQKQEAEDHARKIKEDAERAEREQRERKLAGDQADLERQRREMEEKVAASAKADAEHNTPSILAPADTQTVSASAAAADESSAAPAEVVRSTLKPDAAWPFPSDRKQADQLMAKVYLDPIKALQQIHAIAMNKEGIDSWSARNEIAALAAPFIAVELAA